MKTLIAFTLTTLPGAAFAMPAYNGECASDADCGDGMACEVTGGASCACPEGESCDCASIEYRSCVPGPCQSNDDCGSGMICATYDTTCASAAPCTPDGFCPEPEPCEDTSVSVCAPQWVLPCQTATDCGPGFECKASEVCTCSAGSASTPANDSDGGAPNDADPDNGGAPYVPEPSDCTCEPSGTNYCAVIETPCDDSSACPSGWSCEHYSVDLPCAMPPTEPDREPGSERPAPPDCGGAPEAPTQGMCFPPYSYQFDAGSPRDDSSESQYEAGTATGLPLDPAPNTGTPNTGTPGNSQNDSGCGAGATSIGGLALMMVALWRRRSSFNASI